MNNEYLCFFCIKEAFLQIICVCACVCEKKLVFLHRVIVNNEQRIMNNEQLILTI